MLQPKRTKYRKAQKGRIKGIAQRGSTISFGTYALKSMDSAYITNRQIESARIAMTKPKKTKNSTICAKKLNPLDL